MVPVSVRTGGEGGVGNRVAPAFVNVPVGAMSPKRRLAEVRKGTRFLKDSMMAMGADAIIGLGAYAPGGLLAAAARAVSRGRWFNLVVSNIPGPGQPMYLAGALLMAGDGRLGERHRHQPVAVAVDHEDRALHPVQDRSGQLAPFAQAKE